MLSPLKQNRSTRKGYRQRVHRSKLQTRSERPYRLSTQARGADDRVPTRGRRVHKPIYNTTGSAERDLEATFLGQEDSCSRLVILSSELLFLILFCEYFDDLSYTYLSSDGSFLFSTDHRPPVPCTCNGPIVRYTNPPTRARYIIPIESHACICELRVNVTSIP